MGGPAQTIHPSGPYRLTTPKESSWTAAVPWIVELPLFAILAYALLAGPVTLQQLVPVIGIVLGIGILALPGLVTFTPTARAWALRTARIGETGITVHMPGKEPLAIPWDTIGRFETRPLSLGLRIPQSLQLVTDLYRIDGTRIAEVTVHHSSYRQGYRRADVNEDGPPFLHALQDTPCSAVFDLASRTLVQLTEIGDDACLDGLSDETVAELRAGRLWHARRSAAGDMKSTDRVPTALVRIDCVLRQWALKTARDAHLERPADPVVRYYLAHAILSHVALSSLKGPDAVARRRRLRDEARTLLESLHGVPELAAAAETDLRALEARALRKPEVAEAE